MTSNYPAETFTLENVMDMRDLLVLCSGRTSAFQDCSSGLLNKNGVM